MAKLIVFSGGCHSGKTTTIERLSKTLDDVIVCKEEIRDHLNISISDIRKDPSAYLSLQYKIIWSKFIGEVKAKYSSHQIALVDRSLIDSLFYLTTYIDLKTLTLFEKICYRLFRLFVQCLILISTLFLYEKIYLFTPLPGCVDTFFRPKDLDNKFEFEQIYKLYKFFGIKFTLVSALEDNKYV